jgi:hypothetical protein
MDEAATIAAPFKERAMDNQTLESRLEELREQNYPLEITPETADALVECIRRIMACVPEDEQIFVRADYASATSALCHPAPISDMSEPE